MAAVLTPLFLFLLIIPHVTSWTPPIPQDASQFDSWFNSLVTPYTERGGTLDPALASAEASVKYVTVKRDGSGDFDTVTKAIASVPSGNTNCVMIWIGPGNYWEKIIIEADKPFVTLYGSPSDMPVLEFNGTAAEYGTVYSATLAVMSDYFMAANLIIVNKAPKPDGQSINQQAVALKTSGDKHAFYNCKVVGFQDTVCDDRGYHIFKDCYIEGTVDFIFGNGKSLYLRTELHVVEDGGYAAVTAQGRNFSNEDDGFSFVHCNITGSETGAAYLGRAWWDRALVVYAYTTMGNVVKPAGWTDRGYSNRDSTVFFGEYKCTGPGSDLSKRVKYSNELSNATAQTYLSLDFIQGTTWLLPPPT